MPIVKEKEFTGKSRLSVWKIEESVEELQKLFHPNDLENFERLKTEKRRKEFLAARLALANLQSEPLNIAKDENGKPYFLNSEKHLSISHADTWAAAIIAENPTGIDIENYRDKIFKVAHKFRAEAEGDLLKEVPEIEALTLLWSAKEAVFKRFSHAHLDFLGEMELDSPLENKEGEIRMKLRKSNLPEFVSVYYEMRKDYVLTWSV